MTRLEWWYSIEPGFVAFYEVLHDACFKRSAKSAASIERTSSRRRSIAQFVSAAAPSETASFMRIARRGPAVYMAG